ncbi:HAD-IA family hydrolase [Candidatus Micrarchaeota archaeon]|nr:HAD-IA family hydrolase [Candidatus Micrarchaeota archaeon]
MILKGLVFDLDGTLTSTRADYWRSLVKTVARTHGCSEMSEEDLPKFWFGHKRDEIISSWGIPPKDFWKVFRELDSAAEREKHVFVFEDVSFLKNFKRKGLKLGVVTQAPSRIAGMELKKIPVEFDSIVLMDSLDRYRFKPDPAGVHRCLRELGIGVEEAVYVGNSEEDYLTSKNAGIRFILLDRGEHEASCVEAEKVKSLYELWGLLNSEKGFMQRD